MLVLLLACTDAGVQTYNTPPTVAIRTPDDGAAYNPGDLVELYGVARDAQDGSEELQIAWESSIDGVFDTTAPDVNGDMHLAKNDFTEGLHVLTLSAVDSRGESASTSISLQIGDVTNQQGAPTIVIVSPNAGEQVGSSATVNLLATVTDDLDAPDSLPIEVVDDPDGIVWNGYPTSTGTLQAPFAPHTLGVHTVTVNALDSEGKKGSASVSYEVIQDNVPLVNIQAPNDGDWFDTVDTITFRGNVGDDTTPKEQIVVQWTSDLQGVLSAAPPDSNGDTTFGTQLLGGTHVITLTAADLDGNIGRDTLVVNVDDPLARDDDGDGYTEYGGDCDDTDDTLSPGEVDICDAIDQDCDGYINDPYWDTYEYNSTRANAYNLGSVDSGFWTGSSIELSGLTFSDATDEDWFYWEAEDELWDNVEVQVIASGLNVAGDYIIELYSDGGTLLGSDSGDGSITASFTSDIFDDGDDAFYVRVYPVSGAWPAGSCSNSYKLKIKS
jgi:hypothetical protein